MSRIEMHEVESSQIHAIGHDAETNTLAIRFTRGFGRDQRPGALYHYKNVTAEDFAAFRDSESKGKHFGAHIKSNVEKYPFERIESEPVAA